MGCHIEVCFITGQGLADFINGFLWSLVRFTVVSRQVMLQTALSL